MEYRSKSDKNQDYKNPSKKETFEEIMIKNFHECKGKKKSKTSDEKSKRVPILTHKIKKMHTQTHYRKKSATSQIKINTKR